MRYIMTVFVGIFVFIAISMALPYVEDTLIPKEPYTPPALIEHRVKKEPLAPEKPVTLTFVGDIMLDRHIRSTGNIHGYDYVFSHVGLLLEESDLVVGNLEGPVTKHPSRSFGSAVGDAGNFTFTLAPVALETLAESGIRTVSIGNNHILNYGTDGLTQTKTFLTKAGIAFFGDPNDMRTLTATTTLENTTVGFVAYNAFHAPSSEQTIAAIKNLASSTDFVTVYAHWGTEYNAHPNETQRTLAHRFVDAGADLIIGSHPHVIQDKEVYKNVPIYYSLGNFVFDQYWNESVRCGALVTVTLENGLLATTTEHFTLLHKDGTTRPSDCAQAVPTWSSITTATTTVFIP